MKTSRFWFFMRAILLIAIAGNSTSSSGFPNNSRTDSQTEYLETFSRAYGYVKYFHPSDEADKIDWDKFAIYGSEKILLCKNQKQFLETLNDLFNPIAPTVKFYQTGKKIKFDISSLTPPDTTGYKKTYWQHLGVDKGMQAQRVLYNSVRVNRDKIVSQQQGSSTFATFATYINAKQYQGRKIKMTGKVKLVNGSEGTGHLWVRVDLPDKKMGFFDNMGYRPITKNEWCEYEIAGIVDSSAAGIAAGSFLNGAGELLVDDFHIYTMEGDKWAEIPLKYNDFEADSLAEITNSKVWWGGGKGYQYALLQDDGSNGTKCVSIKKSKKTQAFPGEKIFDKEPAFGEVVQEDIGSGISCLVPLVLYCTKENTYPAGNAVQLEDALSKINKNDFTLPMRLGDVINTWNLFQHFYPYFDVVNVDWSGAFRKAAAKCFTDRSDWDFLITLREMTAKLKDGHIRVYSKAAKSYMPPISWEFIEGKLVITGVYSEDIPIKPGDVVEKIDGQDPESYFNVVKSRISAATNGWMAYRAQSESLLGDKDSKLTIVVENKSVDLTRNMTQNDIYQKSFTGPVADKTRLIGDDIVYVNINNADMKDIDTLLPQIKAAKALICDLRGYPRNTTNLITYLMKQEEDTKWMLVPQIIYPDHKNVAGYQEHGWNLKPSETHIDTKVIFLTDGSAISYAESYMGYIEGFKLATVVGQPTAGTNGNVNPFTLPGGYSIYWTGMKVLKHDGSQHHGVGIIPDVLVNKTIKGVKEGRDEFLEKAIEIVKSE
ncbi:MAG: S41 family peptidase [Bacteroidales bacterium]|nr:S41 family peptidase [Bacteroidales bacterium]